MKKNDEELRARVLELVEENPGIDVAYLVEATGEDTTTRAVRAAIKASRLENGLDSPRHIVALSGRYYMPPALSALGYTFQPNKNGTTLLAKKPKEAKKSEEDRISEFKAMIGDRHDHEQILELLVEKYSAKLDADLNYKEVCAEVRGRIASAEAGFKEIVEAGREGGATEAVVKLEAIENGWQTLEEKKAFAIEERKEARAEKNAKAASFLGLIENLGQLEMVFK